MPWTEEPGGPQSIGSQRVGYDSVTNSFFWAADFWFLMYSHPVEDLGISVGSLLWKSLSHLWGYFCLFAKACPTLYYPMDCSLPGSTVHGISQARILEWVAISSSRGSSQPRDQSYVSCIGRKILYHWAAQEAHHFWGLYSNIPKALPPLIVTLGIRILRCEVWGRHRHSGASLVDQNPPAMKETCFNFWAG